MTGYCSLPRPALLPATPRPAATSLTPPTRGRLLESLDRNVEHAAWREFDVLIPVNAGALAVADLARRMDEITNHHFSIFNEHKALRNAITAAVDARQAVDYQAGFDDLATALEQGALPTLRSLEVDDRFLEHPRLAAVCRTKEIALR